MKIRTRLLLFLLPTIILSNLLIASFLSYNWYLEIYSNFQNRFKSALQSMSAMMDEEEKKNASLHSDTVAYSLQEHTKQIRDEINITSLSIIRIKPAEPQKPLTLTNDNYTFYRSVFFPGQEEETVTRYDFHKESDHIPYLTKSIHMTSVHTDPHSGRKIMTGYAPIFDKEGNVAAILAANASISPISQKLQEKLLIIIFTTAAAIALVFLSLLFVSNKIAHPVQRLNNTALAIAAGQYGDRIQVKGPKEIVELANTLNTMSECLHENINRLKENSLLRERMYGEYECAMLLQHLMLQKMIDECKSDAIAVKAITIFSENPKGLLLDLPKNEKNEHLQIHLVEAKEEGFEGMYDLLTQYKLSKETAARELDETFPHLHVTIDTQKPSFIYSSNHFTTPILWSMANQTIIENTHGEVTLGSGDFLFLFNQSLITLCENQKKIQDLIAKIFRFFGDEGLETCASMLQKELSFLVKKKDLEEDIHLICFQLLV